MAESGVTKTVLIFDGSCGFCTMTVGWLTGLDRRGRLRVVPFQIPGTPEAHGLTLEACRRAAWAVKPDRSSASGAGAIAVALDAALGTHVFEGIYRLPGVGRLQDAGYRWIARNRHHLPGRQPFCQSHPGVCGPDEPAEGLRERGAVRT
jgi:predicted DCC family thiol-disulfide oxidoreductase YuxK